MATPKKPKDQHLKVGRPPIPFYPEYCELLVKHMAAGYSFESFGAHCDGEKGVGKDTLYKWVQEYPEFSEAKKRGELKSRQKWEEMGMEGMCGLIPGFNSGVWHMSMKNKFGYRDQVDIKSEHTETKNITISADKKVQELVDKIAGLLDGQAEVNEIREVRPVRIKSAN